MQAEFGQGGASEPPIPLAHAHPVAAARRVAPGPVDGDEAALASLLGGVEDHDDERIGLATALSEAALHVKETYAALKTSLEPLTFAYGYRQILSSAFVASTTKPLKNVSFCTQGGRWAGLLRENRELAGRVSKRP